RSMTRAGSSGGGWGRSGRRVCSTEARSGSLARDRFHLAQPREASERVVLDLADALAGQTEPPADLLQRLRVGVVEPVAEDQHLALALRERRQRLRERLAAQQD